MNGYCCSYVWLPQLYAYVEENSFAATEEVANEIKGASSAALYNSSSAETCKLKHTGSV